MLPMILQVGRLRSSEILQVSDHWGTPNTETYVTEDHKAVSVNLGVLFGGPHMRDPIFVGPYWVPLIFWKPSHLYFGASKNQGP